MDSTPNAIGIITQPGDKYKLLPAFATWFQNVRSPTPYTRHCRRPEFMKVRARERYRGLYETNIGFRNSFLVGNICRTRARAGNQRLEDHWPRGGGTTIGPAISPFDSRMVVEHCDMTAVTSRATVASRGGCSIFAAASAFLLSTLRIRV